MTLFLLNTVNNGYVGLQIPRHVMGKNSIPIDIHFFSDASQDAYSSCCYIRSQSSDQTVTVSLLCSKTKVAPIKTLFIPRLELCAALLSAQLSQQVQKALNFNLPIYFWIDSQVVLAWLNYEPNQLEIFVANRVSKIHHCSKPDQWHYVPTKLNAADIASRGMLPNLLLDCPMWWEGPAFLKERSGDCLDGRFSSECSMEFDIPEVKVKHQGLLPCKA